jgi:hypothetical protein
METRLIFLSTAVHENAVATALSCDFSTERHKMLIVAAAAAILGVSYQTISTDFVLAVRAGSLLRPIPRIR